nr:hypothetical protein [Ottowia sp.]
MEGRDVGEMPAGLHLGQFALQQRAAVRQLHLEAAAGGEGAEQPRRGHADVPARPAGHVRQQLPHALG